MKIYQKHDYNYVLPKSGPLPSVMIARCTFCEDLKLITHLPRYDSFAAICIGEKYTKCNLGHQHEKSPIRFLEDLPSEEKEAYQDLVYYTNK